MHWFLISLVSKNDFLGLRFPSSSLTFFDVLEAKWGSVPGCSVR